VVQHEQGRISEADGLEVSSPNDALERESYAVGAAAASALQTTEKGDVESAEGARIEAQSEAVSGRAMRENDPATTSGTEGAEDEEEETKPFFEYGNAVWVEREEGERVPGFVLRNLDEEAGEEGEGQTPQGTPKPSEECNYKVILLNPELEEIEVLGEKIETAVVAEFPLSESFELGAVVWAMWQGLWTPAYLSGGPYGEDDEKAWAVQMFDTGEGDVEVLESDLSLEPQNNEGPRFETGQTVLAEVADRLWLEVIVTAVDEREATEAGEGEEGAVTETTPSIIDVVDNPFADGHISRVESAFESHALLEGVETREFTSLQLWPAEEIEEEEEEASGGASEQSGAGTDTDEDAPEGAMFSVGTTVLVQYPDGNWLEARIETARRASEVGLASIAGQTEEVVATVGSQETGEETSEETESANDGFVYTLSALSSVEIHGALEGNYTSDHLSFALAEDDEAAHAEPEERRSSAASSSSSSGLSSVAENADAAARTGEEIMEDAQQEGEEAGEGEEEEEGSGEDMTLVSREQGEADTEYLKAEKGRLENEIAVLDNWIFMEEEDIEEGVEDSDDVRAEQKDTLAELQEAKKKVKQKNAAAQQSGAKPKDEKDDPLVRRHQIDKIHEDRELHRHTKGRTRNKLEADHYRDMRKDLQALLDAINDQLQDAAARGGGSPAPPPARSRSSSTKRATR
jgi:hypothetical protein